MEKKETKKTSNYVVDIIISIIVLPIVFISVMVIYKSLVYPNEIPDIFTYKPFIILDGNMEISVEDGDLAITQIVDTNSLKKGDVIAFRTKENTVMLQRVLEIQKSQEGKKIIVNMPQNKADTTEYLDDKKVEGVLVNKIKGLGNILMYLQDPMSLLLNIIIILIVGLISYYIAGKMDKRDKMKEFEKFII